MEKTDIYTIEYQDLGNSIQAVLKMVSGNEYYSIPSQSAEEAKDDVLAMASNEIVLQFD